MKTLTDNRIAKVPGFERATELDFSVESDAKDILGERYLKNERTQS